MLNKPTSPFQTLLKKQFPTLIGVGVLVLALVVGLVFFSQGTGVFAPRATPETTPQKVKITNITDSGFTVSFLTDESVAGFVKYGTSATDLDSQASDDRDQLSGTVGSYQSHHITVRGLQPNTSYFFTVGTTSRSSFDNNGQPFTVTTTQRNGAPSAAKTIYGTVMSESGNPAANAIVYIALDGVGEMSTLVKDSGSWAIPLSNARTADGSGYADVNDDMMMSIMVQGPRPTQIASSQIAVADSQPVPTLTFGETSSAAPTSTSASSTSTAPATASPTPDPMDTADDEEMMDTDEDLGGGLDTPSSDQTRQTGGLDTINADAEDFASDETDQMSQDLSLTEDDEVIVVDLSKADGQKVTTSQPIIVGTAAPQTSITIEVNSETQITETLVTDANGDFELDLSEYASELEPGEHTVTITYTDPATGQQQQTTRTFTVEPVTLAQANTNSYPYSSSNPYPIGGATGSGSTVSPSPSPSPTTPATGSGSIATDSGRTSQPATDAAVPVSGSVGSTFALIFGGIFFVLAGFWSHWLAHQVEEAALELEQ